MNLKHTEKYLNKFIKLIHEYNTENKISEIKLLS